MRNLLLVIIQTVLCLLIALGALAIKLTDSDIYPVVREYYYSHLNASVLVEDNYEG